MLLAYAFRYPELSNITQQGLSNKVKPCSQRFGKESGPRACPEWSHFDEKSSCEQTSIQASDLKPHVLEWL